MGDINLTSLTTEKRNPETMNLDEMKREEIITIMNREDRKAVDAVENVLSQVEKVISCTVASLKRGGRIIYRSRDKRQTGSFGCCRMPANIWRVGSGGGRCDRRRTRSLFKGCGGR